MGNRHTIFVIDDDPDIVELYEATLNSIFNLKAFSNGNDAVAAGAAGNWPDAMLVDLVMPDLDGLETITKAKAAGFVGPFVICSGHADKNRAIKAIAIKAYALIEKPFHGVELINTLKHAVFEDRMTQITTKLLKMNSEMAQNTKVLSELYEQRLAEAENLMFSVSKSDDERKNFLDHKTYYDVFARVTQRIDVLSFEIELLQKEQENMIEWNQMN